MPNRYTRISRQRGHSGPRWLLVFLLSFITLPAMASHFRAGTLTWQRDLSYTGPGYRITFTLTESWRRGFQWSSYGTQSFGAGASATLPDPGEQIRFYNQVPLSFGDGTPVTPVILNITSVVPVDATPANDIVNGVFIVSHVYQPAAATPLPVNYVAFTQGNERISAGTGPTLLQNNGDASYRLETTVTVGNNNDAPVATLPPVVGMINGQNPATYQIPATDPNGDAITFSLAPVASFMSPNYVPASTQPFPVTGNPSASTRVTVSSTGLVSFNTATPTSLVVGNQYSLIVRLTDARGAITHVDVVIRIVNNSAPPFFDYGTGQTPPNNTTYTVPYGTNVLFNVRARDPNPADAVSLFGVGLPVGATQNPALPLLGPPNGAAATAFSWTPTASQTGNNVLSFIAQDPQGVQKTTTVNVNVTCRVSFTAAVSGASCNGATGSITVSTTGGTGPFTYSKDGGISFGTSGTFNGLPAGNYAVQVKEATGCVVERNVAVGAIPDTQPPTITAPADVTVGTGAGRCDASGVTLGTAVTADNCVVGTVTNDAPAIFPKGTTTVTWTVTDGASNTATATQNVTVNDTEAPTIMAPAGISANADNGQCYATLTSADLGTTAFADNCTGSTITNDVPADNRFPVGTTTVTWTVTDAGNNTATATQAVTVSDNQLPTITAPANITANTDGGQCSAGSLSLGTPTTADNCGVASVNNDAPSVFPKGTTTVTWTVRDVHNNTATATQTVTVEDRENPIIAAPIAIAVNADAGQCYATIPDLGFPSFQDNCPGSTYTSTANATNRYAVGITIVGYTVTDASGNKATAFQSVVVTDNQNPGITAPANLTVATDPAQCTATGITLGNPATADNCGVSSVTNDAPTTFVKGSTVVTWTVRDVNGNMATATQTVTVEDRQLPSITAPANVTATTSADGTGNCSTTAATGMPVTADNCGAVMTTARVGAALINPATYAFPTGTTTITWTATDGSGNNASAMQTVTVTDNEAPLLSCPANVAQCYSAAGNPVTLNLTATDNCSATTTSWAMSGAGTGTGTGGTITRSFATGTTNILWQVRDAANNLSVCTTTVVIRPAPAVTIAASGADDFCNTTTLTASIAPAGAATYAWTYNNAPFATTETIRLRLSNGDGSYRVVATDANGCSSAPATYNFQKQSLVNMYVLLGMKEVDLAQNNDVINGSVGVTSSHGEADFDKYCSVASPGAFVKAKDIDTKSPVNIPTKIYSQAIVTLPTMYLNTSNPGSLSNYVMTGNGTVSGNKKDLTINANKTVTVTGSIFRRIRICHGADVTFTAADISLESLDIDYGATVSFTGNTRLRVTDEVTIDKECSINPGGKVVTFYVKEPASNTNNCFGNWSSWHSWTGGGSSEKFTVDGKGTSIIANVYMPNGKLRVHGNGWNCWWGQSESCNMMGLFIAEEIEGDGKNITWYSYDCSIPASFRQVAHTAPMEEAAGYDVLMYPNPTTGEFSLQFGNTAEAAQVRITDIQGRLVSSRTVAVSEMPSAGFNIRNQAPGVYLVEIRQGASTVRNRIVLR